MMPGKTMRASLHDLEQRLVRLNPGHDQQADADIGDSEGGVAQNRQARHYVAMILRSITANRHIIGDQVNGKPVRFLLNFENNRFLRLAIAGDGARIVLDNLPLDEPFDMDEYGKIDVSDVTKMLFPELKNVEIVELKTLDKENIPIGLRLSLKNEFPFYFWIDGDEFYWGNEEDLNRHDWLDCKLPTISARIEAHPPD